MLEATGLKPEGPAPPLTERGLRVPGEPPGRVASKVTSSGSSAPKLPEFTVWIVCPLAEEEWHLRQLLGKGRNAPPPMVYFA